MAQVIPINYMGSLAIPARFNPFRSLFARALLQASAYLWGRPSCEVSKGALGTYNVALNFQHVFRA